MNFLRSMIRLGHSDRTMQAFLELQSPIVLMGRGHSGTRLLSYAVRSLGVDLGFTDDVASGDPEDKTFRRGLAIAARKWNVGDEPTARELRPLRKLFYRWRRNVVTGTPWGWKYPESYLMIAHVHRIFPDARYIHIVRDGRDLAFKRHRTSDPTTRLGLQVLTTIGALEKPPHVQAALSWAYQVNHFRDFARRCIGPDRVHEVTFEAFCRDPNGETERIARYVGLEMPDATRKFLAGFIDPGKIAQHRNEDPQCIAEVEAAVRPTLEVLGYLPVPV